MRMRGQPHARRLNGRRGEIELSQHASESAQPLDAAEQNRSRGSGPLEADEIFSGVRIVGAVDKDDYSFAHAPYATPPAVRPGIGPWASVQPLVPDLAQPLLYLATASTIGTKLQ